jgi:hypothetical protein
MRFDMRTRFFQLIAKEDETIVSNSKRKVTGGLRPAAPKRRLQFASTVEVFTFTKGSAISPSSFSDEESSSSTVDLKATSSKSAS